MEYRHGNMHVNSSNDASTLCKNFVNFVPVTPEMTDLIYRPTHLYSSCCHSEAPWNIRMPIDALTVVMIVLRLI